MKSSFIHTAVTCVVLASVQGHKYYDDVKKGKEDYGSSARKNLGGLFSKVGIGAECHCKCSLPLRLDVLAGQAYSCLNGR